MPSFAPKEQRIDMDFSNMPVPLSGRMQKFSLTMAWWSCCSAMFYIVVGASLGALYGTRAALVGIVLSVITYGIVNGVLSRYAIRTGLSVSLFSRVLVGTVGAALATLIFFATAIYYAVFEGSVIAVALHHQVPAISYPLAAFIVVLYSVPLLIGSVQNWLDKLNGVLLPFYVLGLLGAVAFAIHSYGYSNAWLSVKGTAPTPDGWWKCYIAYMGVWVLMLYTFDYARFGREQDSAYHERFNFGIPFYAVAFLLSACAGIFLVDTIPLNGAPSDVSVVFSLLKVMGLAGLFFIWVTQTRINTANYYLATVNMEAFGKLVFRLGWHKMVWAVIVGGVVFALMLANVFSYILVALTYQAIFVVSWVAIALTHVVRNTAPATDVQHDALSLDRFHIQGLAAWFAGAAVGVILANMPGIVGTFSAPATALIAGATYGLLAKPRQSALVAG
jgi:hypothetical protein